MIDQWVYIAGFAFQNTFQYCNNEELWLERAIWLISNYSTYLLVTYSE